MRAQEQSDDPRLTLAWRRGMVAAGSAAAVGIAALNITLMGEPAPRLMATLMLGTVLFCAFWLVADSTRPWLTERGVGPEERAHADAALRRAYKALFMVALVVMAYLYIAESRPELALDETRHGTLILWYFVALVLLLPIAIAAWTEPSDGFGARVVGPIELTRSRFSGPSAAAYAMGALVLTSLVPLTFAGLTRIRGQGGIWIDAVIVLVILMVIASAGVLARQLWVDQSAHGPRS